MKVGDVLKKIMRRGGKDGILKLLILQHFVTPDFDQTSLNCFLIPPHLMINNNFLIPKSFSINNR
jgi:hypothetical protein